MCEDLLWIKIVFFNHKFKACLCNAHLIHCYQKNKFLFILVLFLIREVLTVHLNNNQKHLKQATIHIQIPPHTIVPPYFIYLSAIMHPKC